MEMDLHHPHDVPVSKYRADFCDACSSWGRAHLMTSAAPDTYGKNQDPCKNTYSPSTLSA